MKNEFNSLSRSIDDFDVNYSIPASRRLSDVNKNWFIIVEKTNDNNKNNNNNNNNNNNARNFQQNRSNK